MVRLLQIDAITLEVVGAMREAGVDPVLLKGRSFARWLYDSEVPRAYVDIDLLIRESELSRVEDVLGRLGFERSRDSSWLEGWSPLAQPWMRIFDGAMVDVHLGIPGVGVDGEDAWSVLAAELEPMCLAGQHVTVLTPAARALHVLLHVAQHDANTTQPLEDLARALEKVDRETWIHAACLARQLSAIPSFVIGLGALPAGEDLARELGMPSQQEAALAWRSERLQQSLRALADAPGITAKLRMILAKITPSRAFMRSWSPLARRGGFGMAIAYAWRPLWLVGRALTALPGRRFKRR